MTADCQCQPDPTLPVAKLTASNITDPELDQLRDRAEDAEARLAAAAELLTAGYSAPVERADIVRRLCAGEITPEQARAEDRLGP
ncbi:hypothetical protein F4556_004986 [Kitasatospora gansuensis]|uniref:Antitoxin VbhA domain-containing protein n=1 Tax=Kitasatospora gansuensis TaxID=258050 RepID=A0A7W7SHL0_9ACTN|nr:hypothetical protein [Kitasatospora gansuensis]MBB4949451.1 hypothetical protein [Kitasatospora gansuensis]